MHPDLAHLVVLQSIDDDSKRLRDEMSALSGQVAAAEARLKTATAELTQVREKMAKEEALRRKEESEIADLREKVARAQKKIDLATTTAQLTALEHEVAFAKSEISRLEDQELESMERSETLDSTRTTAEAASSEATASLDRERARAAEMTAHHQRALADLDTRRTALRAEIATSETGDNSLSMYDRIARSKGTAVAQALDHKCSACQMMVRPQRWNDLTDNTADSPSTQNLMTCENCGRMLYYDPARDAPQRKNPQSTAAPERKESIAAQIVRSSI